jgi:CheY-like chemotaxis protein
MEVLPPNLGVPPWLASRVLLTDMIDKDLVGTLSVAVMPDHAAGLDERRGLPTAPRPLPFPQPLAGSKRPDFRSSSARSTTRKRPPRNLKTSVLVVDDVPDVTEMIALFLKHAGYEVVTADSATKALQLAESRNFDLVISDIGMPEMNGYELAGALRSLADYQNIPIIAVTGYTEYDDRGRSLKAGFNAHLTKPIDPAGLLGLINTLLS